jgi:hypothetical protein
MHDSDKCNIILKRKRRNTFYLFIIFITKHCFSKKVVIKNQTAEIRLKEMRNPVCLSEFDVTATQPHYSESTYALENNMGVSRGITLLVTGYML